MTRRAFQLAALTLVCSLAGAQKLSAPTFYVAARVDDCSGGNIRLRGVTNLPEGAIVGAAAARMVGNGWSYASEPAYGTVDKIGSFVIQLHPKSEERFVPNLLVHVFFGPAYHAQPISVLAIVGRKGEKLGDFNNPQFGQVSGEDYYLETIVRVYWCAGAK